jgi:hypothetical protein
LTHIFFRLFFLTLLFCSTVALAQQRPQKAAAPKNYPPKVVLEKEPFRQFSRRFDAFKKKYDFNYLTQILDSVGCTVGQLAYAATPITLPVSKHLSNQDTAAAVLIALRNFIDENQELFHTNSKEIALLSMNEQEGVYDVIFERAVYGKFRSAGKTRGMLEFVISKQGAVAVLVCTATRRISNLPNEETYALDKVYKSLIGKKLEFAVDEKQVRYEIDRIDVIKLAKTCVYEKKTFEDVKDKTGNVVERRLRVSEVRLAYEIEIDIKYTKPIARIFIDAVTGEELALEYPFLEN